jgi:hypothetical protein
LKIGRLGVRDVEGASIENTARIFFEFKEAIVLNITVTKFVILDESGFDALPFGEMIILPNPNKVNFNAYPFVSPMIQKLVDSEYHPKTMTESRHFERSETSKTQRS